LTPSRPGATNQEIKLIPAEVGGSRGDEKELRLRSQDRRPEEAERSFRGPEGRKPYALPSMLEGGAGPDASCTIENRRRERLMGEPRKPKNKHSLNWGGKRASAGRWSKDETAALERGDSDSIVAAIGGRDFKAIQAKRAKMKPAAKVPAAVDTSKALTISQGMISEIIAASEKYAKQHSRLPEFNPFQLPAFPPKAVPPKKLRMAMDESMDWAGQQWAGEMFANVAAEGLIFLGYPFLSELAQRPEYRVISETIADDATRKWIDFEVTGNEKENRRKAKKDPAGEAERMADPDERKKRIAAADKTDKVKALKDDQARLEVRDRFYGLARDDGFFGRSHLYMNFGEDADGDQKELQTDIGDGREAKSKDKIAKGKFKEIKVVEAVWTYPTTYNANNPLRQDWYNPQVWYVMGQQIHASRLPMFVGHPVPDMLKPAYSFGGLSLSQMAKPYIDIWLRTKESVAALIHSFSVMVLMTDMQSILQPGNAGALIARAALFNALRDNQGLMVINKATEDFKNVSASLGGLHELQAQAQEHVASIPRIPLVKFTGLQPAGLNACLPGDTLILTDRGQVPIRDVALSDQVMTRRGLAPLTFSGVTKYATELIEIKTASTSLRCTANHPIWIPSINEFVPAENVRHGDLLLLIGEKSDIPNMRHPLHGAVNGGGGINTATISRGMLTPSDWYTSIAEYGRRIAALFQRVSTSITSTAISKIIRSPILSRCMEFSMPHTTASNLVYGNVLSGINPYVVRSAEQSSLSRNFRAERNFAAMPVRSPTGDQPVYLRQDRTPSAFASYVARLSVRFAGMRNFARANVQPRVKTAPNTDVHTILRTPKNGRDEKECVRSVRIIRTNEPVYDLTVAAGYLPEFFANGILTHNSSEGEIKVYDDTIAGYQNRFFRPGLTRVVNFEQLSLFGEVDPEITIVFEPLRELTEKERGENQKADAERDQIYVDQGALAPGEVRKRIVDDPDLPYADLDVEDEPDLEMEEQQGLVPQGGKKPGGEGGGKGGEGGGQDANLLPFDGAADAANGFDPNEPRDPTGEWTTGGGGGSASKAPSKQAKAPSSPGEGHIFASPNVKALKFEQAKAALAGARQHQMAEAFRSVTHALGLKSTERPAIGAWSDGAENSVISDIGPTTFDKLEIAGAMMGALANQKAVLVFQAGAGDNSHFLASFDAKGSLADIHERLLANGLPFHTLEPTTSGCRVYIYGTDAKTRTAASKAGKSYGSKTDIEYGTGKFIGSSKEDGSDDEVRADAQAVYEDTIRRYAGRQPGGSNLGAAWQGLRNRWSAIGKTPQDVKGRFARSHGDKSAMLNKNVWATNANDVFTHIDQVTKAALPNQRKLQAVGAAIAADVPGVVFKPSGAKTSVGDTDQVYEKGVKRVLEKAETRGLGGVTDVVRAGYIVKNPDQRDAIVAGLRKHFDVIDEGYQRNQWGYYDAKVLVRFEDGMIGEVQMMETNLERAKSSKGEGAGRGHDLYDAGRSMPVDDPKRQALMEQSQRLYAAAVERSDPHWNEIYGRAPMKAN
jgi:hypothetical protein